MSGAEEGTQRDGTFAFLNNNVKTDASRKQVKTKGKIDDSEVLSLALGILNHAQKEKVLGMLGS
jgi:hypothetical protein